MSEPTLESYELFFWREKPGADINPERLLNVLEDTEEFPGIEALPLDAVRQAFRQEFPELTDNGTSLEYDGDGSRFQVCFTFLDERTVTLATVYSDYEPPPAIQRILRVAASLGCRVHHPQQA